MLQKSLDLIHNGKVIKQYFLQKHMPLTYLAVCQRLLLRERNMANPQCEDGYTKIANQIIERLIATALTGSEWSLCMFVIRKTYGYKKKTDQISLSQFERECLLSRQTVINCLERLVKANMLVKVQGKISIYGFQKDYEQWTVDNSRKDRYLVKLVSTNSQVALPTTSQANYTETSQANKTYKRKKEKKENNTKESKNKFLQEIKDFKNNFGRGKISPQNY